MLLYTLRQSSYLNDGDDDGVLPVRFHVLDVPHPSSCQALGRVCAAVIDNLGDCVTDRCGSHVARRLLAVAAGRDVSPTQARKPKPSELFDDEDAPAEQPQVRNGLRHSCRATGLNLSRLLKVALGGMSRRRMPTS